MTGTDSAEVLVIGGGPAGAVCSLALARLGRRVVLCEADPFPRDHIGISLSPGIATQLDFLGLGHLLQHPAHRPSVAMERRWGTETFFIAPYHENFIADRGRLDTDLLAAAGEQGVRILQPVRVEDLKRETGHWTVGVSTDSGVDRIQSAFIVDGSGRRSRFRHRRRFGVPTVAVCGDWVGHIRPVVRISAASSAWSWTAPIGRNRRGAVAFTNPKTLHSAEGSLESRYRGLLHNTGVLEPDLALAAKPYVCEATPYIAEDHINGLLRIGDADIALDPLSSCGVQASMQSALCAAPVVNTLLSPSADHAAALEYWDARRAARVADHQAWSADRYAEALDCHRTDFWRARAAQMSVSAPGTTQAATPLPAPDQLVRLSPKAALVQSPCLVDDAVKRVDCLVHPSLLEPVAFVSGMLLHPLLRALSWPKPAQDVVAAWASSYAPDRALALLVWLWRREILVSL